MPTNIKMDWITAFQLASEIVDIIGLEKVDVSTQEKIAAHIQARGGLLFSSRNQVWVTPAEMNLIKGITD